MFTESNMNEEIYKDLFNKELHFNDCVIATFCFYAESERTGRLVQVRKGVGAFGSDVYFIRRQDGSLQTFENVGLDKSDKNTKIFEDDNINREYTMGGKFPETGFVIEVPNQPNSEKQSFALTILQTDDKTTLKIYP